MLVAPSVADENACRIEHAVDREIVDHLTRFMEFVQRCPHSGAKWLRNHTYFCSSATDGGRCEECLSRGWDVCPADNGDGSN